MADVFCVHEKLHLAIYRNGKFRGYDIVARTGEDEFGILAVECGLKGAKGIYDRINNGLQKDGIKATLGIALRNAATGLPRTFDEATNTLLNAKRLRH